MSDEARLSWERRTEWPLAGLALVFLTAYAVNVLYPGLPASVRTAAGVVNVVVWVVFAIDYLVRLVLAGQRRAFVMHHLLDLAILVLPFLRPLRVLRVVIVLTAMDRRMRGSFRGKAVAYVTVTVALLVFVGSLAVLDAERGAPGAMIHTLGDALWWALATVTTVGYGDTLPVTASGRLVAAGMMTTGIVLLGAVTATLASWFVERIEEAKGEERETKDAVAELTAEVRSLRAEIADLRGQRDED